MEKTTATPAPTGCYKCGRPGHWSRDCPSSAPNPNPSAAPINSSSKSSSFGVGGDAGTGALKPAPKVKKIPRSRPKLTPELLLSENGLGYVLRHFPRAFKYRGRGHEVEQVAATRRVKLCLRELRERVASGGDPTKLHESPAVQDDLSEKHEAKNLDSPSNDQAEPSLRNDDADNVQQDMLHEIYQNTAKEHKESLNNDPVAAKILSADKEDLFNQVTDESEIRITEEQRVRMEANRIKALERAAARKRSL